MLVGHSYGGMVISDAAVGNANVKALVYVDAFVPDEGESALGLDATKASGLNAGPPPTIFNFVPYPGAATGDSLTYVKPNVFLKVFANDLPAKEGAVLAATQAPATFSALTTKSGPVAWKTIPSWYVLGTIDHAIPPKVQQFMATRAHAKITGQGRTSLDDLPAQRGDQGHPRRHAERRRLSDSKLTHEIARSRDGTKASHP